MLGWSAPKIGEWFVLPNREGVGQQCHGALTIAIPGGFPGDGQGAPEPVQIHQARVHVEPIPSGARDPDQRIRQPDLDQHRAQAADQRVQVGSAGSRWPVRPQVRQEYVDPDGYTDVIKEQGEQSALFRGTEINGLAMDTQFGPT